MKKMIIVKLLSLIAVAALIVSCGYVPLDVPGTWKISSGEITANTTGSVKTTFKSGTLKIENEKYTWTYETQQLFPGNTTKIEVTETGDCSVNYTAKTLSLNASSQETKTTDNSGSSTMKISGTKSSSSNFTYTINSSTMTLKNESTSEYTGGSKVTVNTEIILTK